MSHTICPLAHPGERRYSQARTPGPEAGPDGSTEAPVLVVGLGEVGGPLLEILSASTGPPAGTSRTNPSMACGSSISASRSGRISSRRRQAYVAAYQPEVAVLNSTVVPARPGRSGGDRYSRRLQPGTREAHPDDRGTAAVPEVRRRQSAHAVGLVEDSFATAGVTTQRMSSVEALELAKLLETSYFGVLLAWAQEMDRFATSVGADYWETLAFFEEIGFFPPVGFQPGFIGGHCVLPNLELLERVRQSPFIDAIRQSNEQRSHEWQTSGRSTAERLSPRPRGA